MPRSLIQKADLALQDLITDGGYLLPKQAAEFIKRMVKQAKLMPMSTVRPLPSPKFPLENIGFAGRILRAGGERTALTLAQRAKPTTGKVEMDAQLFKAEVRLSDETVEDNLERGRFVETVREMMAQQVAADMDELALISDTASSDPDLAKFDGLLKQATSHTYDAGGATLDATVLKAGLRLVPDQYMRDPSMWRYLTSLKGEQDYRHTLSQRGTVMGDRYLIEDVPAKYAGISVEDIPVFPNNLPSGGNKTAVLLTNPKQNVYFGIWRQIKFETDRDISAGEIIIVVTLRYDVKFAIEDSVVKIENVGLT